MPIRKEDPTDRVILRLKSEGLSFTEISGQLCLPRGSVAGRYYRLKGVQHPSQVKRDERLKEYRRMSRIARNKERSSAAVQAAIELRSGLAFSAAVGKARSKGASLEMIGACLGISKQALHKQWQQRKSTGDQGPNYRSGGDHVRSW
jgi:hypothetical protein